MSFQNSLSIDQLKTFLEGGSVPTTVSAKGRHFRYYNVVAKKDDATIVFDNVIAQQAGKIRKQMKELGYRVDMTDIESMELAFRKNLSDNLDRFNPVVPRVDKEPGCVPEYMSIKNRNWHTAMANRLRNMDRVNRQNARDFINQENAKTRIYEKVSGELKFVGSLEDGIAFLERKVTSGEWNMLNWVIYVPDSVYREVTNE